MIFLDANFLIYLNLGEEKCISFYKKILDEDALFTDVLVLDETFYISKKKFNIPYELTLKFLDELVLRYINVLKIGKEEFEIAKQLLSFLKPSDALHVGIMLSYGIDKILSEDKDFDKIDKIKRIWI